MHASVAVAVGDVEITTRADRDVGRAVERPGRTLDRHVVSTVVAGVGGLIQRAERLEQLALRCELPNRVIAVVGAPHGPVGTDADAVRAVRELAFAPRADEAALAIVGDDRMITAADEEHAVLAVDGHTRHVAMLVPFRQLLPALDDLV